MAWTNVARLKAAIARRMGRTGVQAKLVHQKVFHPTRTRIQVTIGKHVVQSSARKLSGVGYLRRVK